jgi:sigma-B regulation protein RsbU (phosphoserine phosphatase)
VWRKHLELLRLPAGAQLFRQGEAADSMFFIESGELAVWLDLPGAERKRLRTLGPGEALGEMALYLHDNRTATVEASIDSVLWRLTANRLAAVEAAAPALAVAMHRHVVKLIAERLAYTNRHVTDPLSRLAQAIRDLAENQFSAAPDSDSRISGAASRPDEVGDIAAAIQLLHRRLQSYLEDLRRATTAREQIESELRIAGRIQMSFLPAPLSAAESARVDFAAFSKPAREAGGDLYDGFFLDERRFFFVVGDVCGKGVSAALFMAVTAMCLRSLAPDLQPVGSLLNRVNELLCQRNDTMQFVTLLAGVLDTETGELTWTNCGHPTPYIVEADGSVAVLDDGRGPPVAVVEGAEYSTQRRVLGPDQILLLYTDGVTEALNPESALYGEERLAELISEACPAGARSCVDLVVGDVETFANGAPQADDLTLIALRAIRAPKISSPAVG